MTEVDRKRAVRRTALWLAVLAAETGNSALISPCTRAATRLEPDLAVDSRIRLLRPALILLSKIKRRHRLAKAVRARLAGLGVDLASRERCGLVPKGGEPLNVHPV